MKAGSPNLLRFLIALVAVLVTGVVVLVMHFDSELRQTQLQLSQSMAVNELLSGELEARQASILEQQAIIADRNHQLSALQGEFDDLKSDIAARSCQSISYEEFDRLVRIGTNYVIYPAKMGWEGFWNIRENVLFERENELARGYEVRVDLTPSDFSDALQEFHSTIRAFHSEEEAFAFFSKRGDENEDYLYNDSDLDLGIPTKIYLPREDDSDLTTSISLHCGVFQADFKVKLLEDIDLAISYLEEAATLFFHDISVWVPFEVEAESEE